MPPAGWFADPSGGQGWRWWDGQRWTEHTSDQAADQRAVESTRESVPPPTGGESVSTGRRSLFSRKPGNQRVAMPQELSEPTGVAVFGEDEILVRAIQARAHALPILHAPATPEERLKGLLLLTNMSKKVLDRITGTMDDLQELSAYDSERERAIKWAKSTLRTIDDTNRLSEEQQRLAAQLGEETSGRVLQEVRDLVDELLAPPHPASRGLDRYELAEMRDPIRIPIFGDDHDLRGFIRARNAALPMMQDAASKEERLAAVLLLTNASQQVVRRLQTHTSELAAMSPTEAGRDEALLYAKHSARVIEPYIPYIDEQNALVQELEEEATQRAVQAATTAMRQCAPDATDDDTAARAPAEDASSDKACPDCAETVKAAARVCRFCGYRFAEAP